MLTITPAMADARGAAVSDLQDTLAGGMCPRGDWHCRAARTLEVHAELPCRVAQPTRGRRRGRVAGRIDG